MNKKGFTLVEMIVVLAILAILMGIAVPVAFGSIENSKKTVCVANRETARRIVPQDEALRDSKYTIAEIEKFIVDNKIICPAKGVFTVRRLRGTVGIDSVVIGCSKHKDGVSESRGVYVDFMQFIDDNPSITSNDTLRQKFFEANGGKWPTLKVDSATYYIQPYYSQTADSELPLEDKVWLYASTDNGTEGKWFAPFVFNPTTEKWYSATTWDGTSQGATAINVTDDIYALEKWLQEGKHSSGKNIWKPLDKFEEK